MNLINFNDILISTPKANSSWHHGRDPTGMSCPRFLPCVFAMWPWERDFISQVLDWSVSKMGTLNYVTPKSPLAQRFQDFILQ